MKEDARKLFLEAMRGATPLKAEARSLPPAHLHDGGLRERNPALEHRGPLPVNDAGGTGREYSGEEAGETSFASPGLPRGVLRKLKRLHWPVRGNLDLHGLGAEQALAALSGFVSSCAKRGVRCICVVHGKGLGSPGRKPVLKPRVGSWLAGCEEVLAFCEAPPPMGGSGALLVLLRVR